SGRPHLALGPADQDDRGVPLAQRHVQWDGVRRPRAAGRGGGGGVRRATDHADRHEDWQERDPRGAVRRPAVQLSERSGTRCARAHLLHRSSLRGLEPIEQPVQGVYRIDLDGRVSLIVADAGKTNGIAVSPDQATLYVAAPDNGSFSDLPPEMQAAPGRKALLAYDLAPDGSAKFRRTVVDFSPAGPDGIGVDRDGNIYCAVQGERQGIYVYSPVGKELAYIPTPESPTNV